MQSIAAKLDDASECSMRRLTARLEDQSRSARTAQWPDPGRGIAEVVRGALKENQAPKGYCPWGGRPNGGHKEGRSLQEPLVRTPEKLPRRFAAAAPLPFSARTCLTLGSRPEPVGSAEPAGEPSAPLKQRLVSRKQIASEAAGSQGVQAHLDAAGPELPSPRRGAVDAGAPAAAVPGARCGEAPGAYSYEALADEDCPSAKRARTGGWLPNPLRGLYAALGGATAGAESGDADAGTPAAAGPVVEAKGRAAPPSAPPAAAGAGSCLATARGIGGEIPGRLMEEMVREQQAAASLVLSPVRGGDDVEGQKSQRWGWRW
ncbi:unnamed protein product [Prorocentrum cordatum]|uniref:Uncharacterized protein n=1 Tax=Prorocentrum cordatum TaxID=2364126 RepID=A0ABN9SZ30_9DINO|nr:unnamed protein product [Polarella glacialis]